MARKVHANYLVSAELADKLNAMTDDEIRTFQQTARAYSTPAERVIWDTCRNALYVEPVQEPMEVGELIDFDDPDWDN